MLREIQVRYVIDIQGSPCSRYNSFCTLSYEEMPNISHIKWVIKVQEVEIVQ